MIQPDSPAQFHNCFLYMCIQKNEPSPYRFVWKQGAPKPHGCSSLPISKLTSLCSHHFVRCLCVCLISSKNNSWFNSMCFTGKSLQPQRWWLMLIIFRAIHSLLHPWWFNSTSCCFTFPLVVQTPIFTSIYTHFSCWNPFISCRNLHVSCWKSTFSSWLNPPSIPDFQSCSSFKQFPSFKPDIFNRFHPSISSIPLLHS